MSSRPSAQSASGSSAAGAAPTSSTAAGTQGQGSQNVSQGHFSVRAQHVSIADEKKYRKKYAELAAKLRLLEKDNDELVTKYETVKHMLLRLKAEKKILIDVLDKIYEQEEQDTNPIPPQSKEGFTVHALPITTERNVIDKALIVPPHKHQALGLTNAPADPQSSTSIYAVHVATPSANAAAAATPAAEGIKRAPPAIPSVPALAPSSTTKQATPAPTASLRHSNNSMDVDQKPTSTASTDAAAAAAGNPADDNNTDMDASSVLSDPGQHPPPAKRPRLASPPASASDNKLQPAQAQPVRKIGSVASLLDDNASPAPIQTMAAATTGPSNPGRPSQSPHMRPAAAATSTHHVYPHPTSAQPSAYTPSTYSSGGPPPPPPPAALPHHLQHHHHAAYSDYPPLHSPTGPTNPPSSSSTTGAPGCPGAFSSRASSVSQLSSSTPSTASSSAYPPPAPPGAYVPPLPTSSVPAPSAPPTSRPGPEYFEPAPYRTGAGAPTSPGAYEYHHHHPVVAGHYHHHAPPPPMPPHRPPPAAYAYHVPPPPGPPAGAYYEYPPPQQQGQQAQQAQYGGQGYGSAAAAAAAARARSPPSANGGGPQ